MNVFGTRQSGGVAFILRGKKPNFTVLKLKLSCSVRVIMFVSEIILNSCHLIGTIKCFNTSHAG